MQRFDDGLNIKQWIIQVFRKIISLISKTGILYYTSKVEYVNTFENKNSCISNFPHINLSFQQLESQFNIF